jgi:hypothetical protein
MLALLAACTVTPLDLDGKACPCPTGYACSSITSSCVAGSSTPGLVQQATATATTGSPLSVSLAVAPQRGDLLVMVGAAVNSALAAVTGGGVASWTRAARSTAHTNVEIWYGVTSGATSPISIELTGNTGKIWMNVNEWSGTAGTLDDAAAMAGSATTATVPAIMTTAVDELVIFAVANQPGTTAGSPTPDAWLDLVPITSPVVQNAWFGLATATATYAPTVPVSGGQWDAAIAAFTTAP